MTKKQPLLQPTPETRVNNYVTSGKATVDQEIKGLQAVYDALDDVFVNAVEMLAACKGRVVITGMGKSGHVAKKIAATMASTGTPAYFVHPAEASHGDMGMITEQDVLVMLSNSGETSELADMITYAKRFSIPLIAIVRRAESTLVQSADIAIVLPDIPEASPTGAPTTSTIMMMAYGDAMAMALLERRGFTKEDFKLLHPGGKLGRSLLKVKELMHPAQQLPLVDAKEMMKDVILTMTAKSFGCAGVIDGKGALVGIITDGDLRRHADNGLLEMKAEDVMHRNPKTISADSLAAEAVAVMNEFKITSLFIVEKGLPKGLIHIHDCLRAGVA